MTMQELQRLLSEAERRRRFAIAFSILGCLLWIGAGVEYWHGLQVEHQLEAGQIAENEYEKKAIIASYPTQMIKQMSPTADGEMILNSDTGNVCFSKGQKKGDYWETDGSKCR